MDISGHFILVTDSNSRQLQSASENVGHQQTHAISNGGIPDGS